MERQCVKQSVDAFALAHGLWFKRILFDSCAPRESFSKAPHPELRLCLCRPWKCWFCASRFGSYQEASVHEEECSRYAGWRLNKEAEK